jgi:hypothetical protein
MKLISDLCLKAASNKFMTCLESKPQQNSSKSSIKVVTANSMRMNRFLFSVWLKKRCKLSQMSSVSSMNTNYTRT